MPIASWFSTVEFGLALATVVVGSIAAGLAWRAHRDDVRLGHLRDLRQALIALMDLRERYATIAANDPHFVDRHAAINKSRSIYLAITATLVGSVERDLSVDDLIALGDENLTGERYDLALWAYELARKRARPDDVINTVRCLLSLADYFANAHLPGSSPDRAEALFRESVSVAETSSSAYGIYLAGFSYERWARATGNVPSGPHPARLQRAQELYRQSASADLTRNPAGPAAAALTRLAREHGAKSTTTS